MGSNDGSGQKAEETVLHDYVERNRRERTRYWRPKPRNLVFDVLLSTDLNVFQAS